MSFSALIKNAKAWTGEGFHETDVECENGRIKRVGQGLESSFAKVDGRGLLLLPGLVDLHAHFPDPNRDDRESFKSGLKAAAAGGFTAVMGVPGEGHPLDDEAHVTFAFNQDRHAQAARLLVCGALSKGRLGRELAEFAGLKEAGALAVGDGAWLADGSLVMKALEYAKMLDLLVVTQSGDKTIERDGAAHDGPVAARLGLHGIPSAAEWAGLARDLLMAEATGGRLHVQGVSTTRSIELVKAAKARGVKVSAECSFHHLIFTDDVLESYDPTFKLNPPLRPQADVEALIEGLKTGVIDCIVTDHTPLTKEEIDVDFDSAEFGAAGLETALSALFTHLIEPGILDWKTVLQTMSDNPRRIAGLEPALIREGQLCDFILFDPEAKWLVQTDQWHSKARNTPFEGKTLTGVVQGVWIGERVLGPLFEEART